MKAVYRVTDPSAGTSGHVFTAEIGEGKLWTLGVLFFTSECSICYLVP